MKSPQDSINSGKKAAVSKLKNWLETLGCEINHKIDYPHEFHQGLFGMIAKEPIFPNEILVLVKNTATFSTELLQNTPLQRIFHENPSFFDKSNPEGVDNQFLSLVLFEKTLGPLSKWKLFFDTMPECIENLYDWPIREMEELQDEDLLIDSRIRRDRNLKSYCELKTILEQYPEFFPNEILIPEIEWCWKILWTRSFMRSPDHSALVPFADFINHGPSSTGFYFVDQKEEEIEGELRYMDLDEMYTDEKVLVLSCKDLYEINFSAYEIFEEENFETAKQILIEANAIDNQISEKKLEKKKNFEEIIGSDFVIIVGNDQNYQKGEQILIEYGNYSNSSLLVHYGFALEKNRYEFVRLKIDLSEILTETQQKNKAERFENAKVVFFLVENQISNELLRAIRALLWRPDHLKNAFFSQSDLQLEQKLLEKYDSIITAKINKFETTLEEDLKISPESVKHKFALDYRILKKKIILNHLSMIKTAQSILAKIRRGIPCRCVEEIQSHINLISYFECIQFYQDKLKN